MTRYFAIGVLSVAALASCARGAGAGARAAEATLEARSGSRLSGVVRFRELPDAVEVEYRISGFAGAGRHGFHIHEEGNCSAPDATSALGHWNPHGGQHGGLHGEGHAGDLGNIEANAAGVANGTVRSDRFRLSAEPSPIGLSVIVHAQPDDERSQPAGNAGPRIACGVIQAR